jgi:hypothetical protein
VDTYVDDDQTLTLVASPSATGRSTEITLVYHQGNQARCLTVDAELAGTSQAATLGRFLDAIDPSFLSYVKASLADRLLHLNVAPSQLDRFESAYLVGADAPTAASVEVIDIMVE